jgi:hypothetical protein
MCRLGTKLPPQAKKWSMAATQHALSGIQTKKEEEIKKSVVGAVLVFVAIGAYEPIQCVIGALLEI